MELLVNAIEWAQVTKFAILLIYLIFGLVIFVASTHFWCVFLVPNYLEQQW